MQTLGKEAHQKYLEDKSGLCFLAYRCRLIWGGPLGFAMCPVPKGQLLTPPRSVRTDRGKRMHYFSHLERSKYFVD